MERMIKKVKSKLVALCFIIIVLFTINAIQVVYRNKTTTNFSLNIDNGLEVKDVSNASTEEIDDLMKGE